MALCGIHHNPTYDWFIEEYVDTIPYDYNFDNDEAFLMERVRIKDRVRLLMAFNETRAMTPMLDLEYDERTRDLYPVWVDDVESFHDSDSDQEQAMEDDISEFTDTSDEALEGLFKAVDDDLVALCKENLA